MFGALVRRGLLKVARTQLKPLEWVLTCGLALLFGVLWWQVGNKVEKRAADYISIIFFFVGQWSWAPMFTALGSFPSERDVLTREIASDSYPIGVWYVAKLVSELPLIWLLPTAFFAICYPLVAMPLCSVPALFGITLLNVEVSNAMGVAIAAALFDEQKAITCAIMLMVYNMCAGGFFINMASLPPWLQWCRYTSSWYYTLGLWTRYALPAEADRAEDTAVMQLLHSRYTFSDWSWRGHPERDVGMLLLFAVSARLLAYIFLRCSKKLRFS